MNKNIGSLEITGQAALVVQFETRPEHLVPGAAATSLTYPKEMFELKTEKPTGVVGTHIKEAAMIVKEWWREGQAG